MTMRDKALPAREARRLELVDTQDLDLQFSPYRVFTREQWAKLRADCNFPLALLCIAPYTHA